MLNFEGPYDDMKVLALESKSLKNFLREAMWAGLSTPPSWPCSGASLLWAMAASRIQARS